MLEQTANGKTLLLKIKLPMPLLSGSKRLHSASLGLPRTISSETGKKKNQTLALDISKVKKRLKNLSGSFIHIKSPREGAKQLFSICRSYIKNISSLSETH